MADEAKTGRDELKDKLSALNEKKEDAFRWKQDISTKIADRIKQVGEFKRTRNDLTKNVRELKAERDKLNAEITAKITEIKASQPKVEAPKVQLPVGPKGERLNSHELARQIKALEQKIETVPMSFEAEQKTMKMIKQLKKQLLVFESVRGMNAETSAKSKEIDELKQQANALHAKVTQMAKQSQEHHEKLIELSKEIEDLKAQEEGAYQEFLGAKQEYMSLSGDMKERIRPESRRRPMIRKPSSSARKKLKIK